MEIYKVAPRGYCKGVVRAITMAKQCVEKYPNQTITILGMLVHNRYVMEALKEMHIQMIDDKTKTRLELLDQVKEGVVIFTAHGIAPEVIEKATQKGLICIDASCPDVMKTQEIVKEYLAQDYPILYVGKKYHPEAEAICSMDPHIHLIEKEQDIPTLDTAKVFVTNQTTMSIFDIDHLFKAIKQRYPEAIVCDEICSATRVRQEAIVGLKKQEIDVLYVVGDPDSNNSNRLAQIAREQGIANVYLIDDVNGIQDHHIKDAKHIAVTSGASTPTYLTNQVISYLETYDKTREKPHIVISDILK